MSKNFGGYLRYAVVDVDSTEFGSIVTDNTKVSRTRLSIKYTF
jgi:hypothetical protein